MSTMIDALAHRAAAEHGWSTRSVLGDLPELVVGRANLPTYGRHVFFRSIGLGLEDVAVAHAVHRLVAGESGSRA